MIRISSGLLLSIILAGIGQPLAAQVATESQRTAPTAITAGQRDQTIVALIAAIRANYVFPEKIAPIVARIESAQQSGRYDVTDAGVLAQRITEDLRAAGNDQHLYLSYDLQRYASAIAPPPADAPTNDAFDRAQSRRDNSGVVATRILPGNIRYLKIARFGWIPDETGAAYDAAMRFLRDGDAIIIDLRGNAGGDGAAVRYLVSHFLDPGTLELSFIESGKPPIQMRALDYLPAGRLKGKPLYVLIDGGVASAGESFAYDVQQFKLGELVGATTLGAANNNRFVPIAPGFMLSVSYGRPIHAVSGTNWEGAGVAPSVPAPSHDALAAAQELALTRLRNAPGVSPEQVADYDWALVKAESQLHPVSMTAQQLRSLTGHYGPIEIRLSGGEPLMVRSGRPPLRLLPLNEDGLFEADEIYMLRVRIRGDQLQTYWKGDPASRSYSRNRR